MKKMTTREHYKTQPSETVVIVITRTVAAADIQSQDGWASERGKGGGGLSATMTQSWANYLSHSPTIVSR